MGRRSGFVGLLNAIARDAARRQRQAESEMKRRQRAQERLSRHEERLSRLQAKEEKQAYIEGRIEETEELNDDLQATIDAISGVLSHTLSVDDTVTFDTLRIKEKFPDFRLPNDFPPSPKEPDQAYFGQRVKKPSALLMLLSSVKSKYESELLAAEKDYQSAVEQHKAALTQWEQKKKECHAVYEKRKASFLNKVTQRDDEVNQLQVAYKSGDREAVETYNSYVLERSDYPDGFPQQFKVAWIPDSKEIIVDYEIPSFTVIPPVVDYKYIKSKDQIEEKSRKPADMRNLYADLVASIALRTIHELLEADQGGHIEVVVFNGYVHTVDPATGKDVRPYLISVRTTKERFKELSLDRIDKAACLRNLGAQVSPQPAELQAVKPIVDFNMVDKRFVDEKNILDGLDSRPNLMELNPFEFENLVSNLFAKMGLDAKLTRSSRDGGVDVIAFDTRPILGGKVVIQAKRYSNTVGVSAVRDLYGTMLNEGANKGILVTTSSYGPDAYDFSKDKPIELIDGGGLLYLLEQIGMPARIIFSAT